MNIRNIPVAQIDDKDRAREDYGDIDALQTDIKQHGLINPITVTKDGDRFRLLAGGRRFRSIQGLKWDTVPCVVMAQKVDGTMLELRENLHRKEFHWAEECILVSKIIEENSDKSQRQLARELGISQAKISQYLQLFRALTNDPVRYLDFKSFSSAYRHMSDHKMLEAEREQAKRNEAKLTEKKNLAQKKVAKKASQTRKQATNETQSAPKPSSSFDMDELVEEYTEEKDSTIFFKNDTVPPCPLKYIDRRSEGSIYVNITRLTDKIPLDDMIAGYHIGSSLEDECQEQLQFAPYDTLELDPPYAVNYKPGDILYRDIPIKDYSQFLEIMIERATEVAKPAARMLIWHANMWEKEIFSALVKHGWSYDEVPIIWNKRKGNTSNARMIMPRTYEQCIMAYRGSPRLRISLNNVVNFDSLMDKYRIHPAHRPPSMTAQLLCACTPPFGSVYSPFLGSGSTIIAGRTCGFPTEGFDIREEYKNKFINYLARVEEKNFNLGFGEDWLMEDSHDNYYSR